MKKLLIILLCVSGAVSCGKDETVFMRSYVMQYIGIDRIRLQGDGNSVSVLYSASRTLCGYWSTGEQKATYDALCEKHNDMTYNRDVTIDRWTKEPHISCIGTDFTSIDIVSDSDFDAEHPAGSSLGDIVAFNFRSLKPYIDSGYTSECRYETDCFQVLGYLISELPPGVLTMVGGFSNNAIGGLRFQSQPTLSKTHKFTVTLTADDGRVFEDSIEMTFE